MIYIHQPSKHRRSGSTMQKCKLRGSMHKWLEARQVKEGFPASPFQRIEDVEAYIGGQSVACLLCGREFKNLLVHVTKIHAMREADYRTRFNIPARYPLCASSVSEYRSAHWKRMFSGKDDLLRQQLARGRALPRTGGSVTRTTFTSEAARINGRTYGGSQPTESTCDWHIAQVSEHRYYSRLPVPEGELSWSGFKKRRGRDAELQERFKAARAARPDTCSNGHALTPENTRRFGPGQKYRSCRTCASTASLRYQARQRAEAT